MKCQQNLVIGHVANRESVSQIELITARSIAKSTTHVRRWLGYVYPSRAGLTASNLGY